ncbi:hypothetical protein GJ744_001131 [Endocarpon pusillum]|uniref:Uncharacterized protein n=1 Tax=Endocarpon pusillum TaxID=364733 RepID=A0A8H7AAL3_9EURO|nr:hypothetical protein GJ744_001131 [Endocarpon pusillum]
MVVAGPLIIIQGYLRLVISNRIPRRRRDECTLGSTISASFHPRRATALEGKPDSAKSIRRVITNYKKQDKDVAKTP